ncbi:hypothetical protein SAMN05421747_12926 [Parapedobacter composti]|uniref:Uncharacterized protein n=1 Tax=Parapedobacter composti TaxID=623281 RepID=A0A1I1M636_9SPHI|nr:hypothetical protein [Parapedobacter composti]SFC80861.1 hypothetical protein SAMN05421747_12926 [Parapedobacter composti]
MKYLRTIAVIITVFTATVAYGQGQHNKPLRGSNNIAQAIQNSLSSVPYLKVGNVTCTISKYATSTETPVHTRFYTEGQVTVDYFDITMSDGKSIRFIKNGERFACNSNDFPPATDGTRFVRYFGSGGAYINYGGKTELGSVSEDAVQQFVSFTGSTFKHIWGSQSHNNDISPIASIQINCLGITANSLENIKRNVNSLREDYDLLKNNNQPKNNQNNQGNAASGNSSSSGLTLRSESSSKTTNTQEATELDFWGNPVVSKTKDPNVNTVDYGGMEVVDNEHYHSQMAMRSQRETRERDPKVRRQEVDNYNNAIYEQAQQGIDQTYRVIDEMEKAKSQLNYSSGKTLLESSGNLASTAISTNNVGMAKTALIGMGVGTIMAIGEGAAKRKATEEARKEEQKKIKAAKEVLKNSRLAMLKSYPEGELPLSSTKSSGNNLYYFIYAYNATELTEQYTGAFVSNVFALGKYPDGTWPMQTKVKEQIATLTPLEEIICGPFYSKTEADNIHRSLLNSFVKFDLNTTIVNYEGINPHKENSPTSTNSPKTDFWGNPINK